MKINGIIVAIMMFCIANSVTAALNINDGSYHIINYPYSSTLWVDYNTPGAETEVELVSGGSIGDGLSVYEDGKVILSGGAVHNGLWTYNNSQLTIYNGFVANNLYPHDNSNVTFSGGNLYHTYGHTIIAK